MTERHALLHGLYAITPDTTADLDERVAAALTGGARVIQYRNKCADADHRLAQARRLAALCRAQDALLLINDDVALAAASGAHGVHLGQDDMPLAAARGELGADAIIGVTCHASLELARAAEAGGADYVAFGRFFASRSKPTAPPAPLSLLGEARHELGLPLVAIGGITPENGAQLIRAGAHMLAAIDGVFAAADIARTVRDWQALFATGEPDIENRDP